MDATTTAFMASVGFDTAGINTFIVSLATPAVLAFKYIFVVTMPYMIALAILSAVIGIAWGFTKFFHWRR